MKKNIYNCDALDMSGFSIINRAIFTYISGKDPLTPFEAAADLTFLTTGKATTVRVNGSNVSLDANERILTQDFLATRWKWDRRKVQRFFERLQADSVFVFKTEGRQGAKYTKIRVARALSHEMQHEMQQESAHDNTDENQAVTETSARESAHENPRAEGPETGHNTKSTKSTKNSILCSTQGPNDAGTSASLEEDQKAAAKRKEREALKQAAKQLIALLNQLAGRSYSDSAPKTLEFTSKRVKEHGLEALEQMLRYKVLEWKETPSEKYLRPTTLFGSPTKTEGYVEAAKQATSNPALIRQIKEAKAIEKRRTEFLLHGKGLHDRKGAPVSDDRPSFEGIPLIELDTVVGRENYNLAIIQKYYPALSEKDKARISRHKANPAMNQQDTYQLFLHLVLRAKIAEPEALFSPSGLKRYERLKERFAENYAAV